MKKIMYITVAFALVFLMNAGLCFADTAIAHDSNQNQPIESDGNPVCTVNLSKNVSLGYKPDTTDASEAQTYSIQSYHTSGNKGYGTASDTTIIKWTTKTEKTDIGVPTAADSSEFSSWTAM